MARYRNAEMIFVMRMFYVFYSAKPLKIACNCMLWCSFWCNCTVWLFTRITIPNVQNSFIVKTLEVILFLINLNSVLVFSQIIMVYIFHYGAF